MKVTLWHNSLTENAALKGGILPIQLTSTIQKSALGHGRREVESTVTKKHYKIPKVTLESLCKGSENQHYSVTYPAIKVPHNFVETQRHGMVKTTPKSGIKFKKTEGTRIPVACGASSRYG